MEFLAASWHSSLPSTNTWILEQLRSGAALPAGYVVAAREQTCGRGRLGRTWVSAPGQDLAFSVLLYTAAEPLCSASAPMAAALAVAAAVEHHCGVVAQCKWPNDLLVAGRKLCGILAERRARALVIGIGLNVNMDAVTAAGIDRPVTSVRLETGRALALEPLLDAVLGALAEWLGRWEVGGFAALRSAWMARCALLGEVVCLQDGAQQLRGRLEGFGPWGQALIRQADGALREAWAGDLGWAGGDTGPYVPDHGSR